MEEVVAVAVTSADQVDKTDIKEYLARERLGRVEEEGRRDSMEEESIDVDDMHKLRVYSQVKFDKTYGRAVFCCCKIPYVLRVF